MADRHLFIGIVVLTITLSIGGVLVSSFWLEDPDHGGRGGAVGVAIALGSLLATRSYAKNIYKALTVTLPQIEEDIRAVTQGESSTTPKVSIEDDLGALKVQLRLEAEGQRNQNICLGISTFVGTIFWGFGDIFSCWMMRLAS